MFYVQPLGTNGLYPDATDPTSGYMLSFGNRKILIDIGSGVFNKLLLNFPPENLDAVIISHYHFDHVSDIGVLSYYLQTKNKRIKVYAPCDESPFQKLIENSPYLDYIPIDENYNLKIGDGTIKFYKTNHPILTFAVSVEFEGKKFSYSSDGNLSTAFESLLENCNLAIIDCGFLKKDWTENKPLLSAYHVGYLGEKYKVEKLLISHFNPTLSRADILNEAKSVYDKILPADNQRYDI